jgi:hypothetical protein
MAIPLLLLLVTNNQIRTADGFKIIDLTNSLGITPVEIGYTKVVNETKPLFHFYNLTRIQKESLVTEDSINKLNNSVHTIDQHLIDDLYAMKDRLFDELDYILPSATRMTTTRTRRGLINALGSAISWLTGVPDAQDEEKINKAIKQIKNKQTKLVHEESSDIKFNHQLITKVNRDLKLINLNNKRTSSAIQESLDLFGQITLVELIKNNLERMLYLSHQLIETVEHCEDNTYHYGILPDNAIKQMNKQLPLLTTEKRALRALSRVNCVFKENLIIVQVNVPLHVEPELTYFPLSYPVIEEKEIFTIPCKEGLTLRRGDQLYRPEGCETFAGERFCLSANRFEDACLIEMLNKPSKTKRCKTVKITGVEPFARYIPECACELSYKRSRITINGRELRVPEVALVHREINDVIPEFPTTYLYFESFPIVRDEVLRPKIQAAIKYAQIQGLSYQELQVSEIENVLEGTPARFTHPSITAITIATLIAIVIGLYLKTKLFKKTNAPSCNNTVLYVPSREAP